MWSSGGGLKKGAAFDASRTEPALQDMIDAKVLPSGPTLVPGCGRGYAVASLAADGTRAVLGIDIAPTAVKAANAYLSESTAHKGEVAVADFFGSHRQNNKGKYALGYDCTFLCAIPTTMRESWAESWSDLLQPGGELVTLVFPLAREGSPDPADGNVGHGPPYALSMKLVTQLLEPHGFELVSAEDVPQDKLARGRLSNEKIARWRKTNYLRLRRSIYIKPSNSISVTAIQNVNATEKSPEGFGSAN